MNILDAIKTRRSIRRFTGEAIEEEDLKSILKAGFQAPSAMNREPREFIVVRDEKLIEEISSYHPYAKMLTKAGSSIVVCGDRNKQSRDGFLAEDCSASIQNMLLAAHGIGLGAVWCGLYPVDELVEPMAEILDLPDNIIPIGMMVVGVKDEEKDSIDRYDESKIHFDKW